MCPFCLATLGLVAAGAAASGGIAALAAKISRQDRTAREFMPHSNQRRNAHDNEQDSKSENSVAS